MSVTRSSWWAPLLCLAAAPVAAAPTPDSCGQVGQPACTILTDDWWENGTGHGCDRGLRADTAGICRNDTREQVVVDDWAVARLREQRQLAADEAINHIMWLNGHNAFNNRADGYALVPNHTYSITDQLRMGLRGISLDVHWFNRYLRLCHGTDQQLGCSPTDRLFEKGIAEISQWLRHPDNRDEVVILHIEDYLDGHRDEFLTPLLFYLGDLIYKPASKPATRWPSLRELLATGKRVIIFNQSDQAGGEWVFDDGTQPRYPHTGVKNFVPYPVCGYNDSIPLPRHHYNAVHFYEDRIALWNGPGNTGVITSEIMRELAACNVGSIGMDEASTARIRDAIWSWAQGEPKDAFGSEDCALQTASGRWVATECHLAHAVACQNETDPDDWRISAAPVSWYQAAGQCPPGYRFGLPRNGYQNRRLREHAGNAQLWLAYNDLGGEGTWSATSGATATALQPLQGCALAGTALPGLLVLGAGRARRRRPGHGTP